MDHTSHPRRGLLALTLALLALKFAVWACDPTVRLFMGDSESYLYSALTGWVPGDRSFVYGRILGALALPLAGMAGIALVQSLAGVGTALLLFALLRRSFGLGFPAAAALALGYAALPSELFYEHMAMAESFGTLCFALMLTAGFRYLDTRQLRWLPLLALAGIATVAFRMSLLPVVLGFTLLPVLVAPRSAAQPRYLRPAHLAVLLAATAACHYAYRHWYGSLTQTQPDYIADTGYFRLGLVAPLVRPEQVAAAGLPADVLDTLGPPLADPRSREAQIWNEDGLINRVRTAAAQRHLDGNRVARKIVARALRADPFGLVRMGAQNLRDYFVPAVADARMADELGDRLPAPQMVQTLRDRYGYDAVAVANRINPLAAAFRASGALLVLALFASPLLGLAAFLAHRRGRRAAALLLALTACGLFLSHALFAHIPSYRYLHPHPFVALLGVGALLAARQRRGVEDGRPAMTINPQFGK